MRGRDGCQIVLSRWEGCGRGAGAELIATVMSSGLFVLVVYLERILAGKYRRMSCSGQTAASASRRTKDGLSISSMMLRSWRKIWRWSIMMNYVVVI